ARRATAGGGRRRGGGSGGDSWKPECAAPPERSPAVALLPLHLLQQRFEVLALAHPVELLRLAQRVGVLEPPLARLLQQRHRLAPVRPRQLLPPGRRQLPVGRRQRHAPRHQRRRDVILVPVGRQRRQQPLHRLGRPGVVLERQQRVGQRKGVRRQQQPIPLLLRRLVRGGLLVAGRVGEEAPRFLGLVALQQQGRQLVQRPSQIALVAVIAGERL